MDEGKRIPRRRRNDPVGKTTSKGPRKINDVVNTLLARRGYANIQQSAVTEAAWRKVAGEGFAEDSRPAAIRRGVLEVVVSSSTVLQELTFRKSELLSNLMKLVPEQKIVDLRFRMGQIK